MNTTYIIIGIILALAAILFFVFKGRKRSHLPPVPKPVEPLPEPEPLPSPTPAPKPEPPVELALPVPPPMPKPGEPSPPFPREHVLFLDLDSAWDIGKGIMDLQNDRNGYEFNIAEAGNYELKTPVILKPGNRLRLDEGVLIAPRTEAIPFRLMEHASIIGEPDSVIYESDVLEQWTVIGGFYGTKENGLADFDITLYGLEIRGVKDKPFNSAPQAVSLGNCKKFDVQKLHINGTHSIGIQLGGWGGFGHSAEDGRVTHCRFTRVASQNLAVVNGRRIVLEYNFFEASGQPGGPGCSTIDLEPNNKDDVLFDILVRGNWFDFRESSVHGNAIIAQAGVSWLGEGPTEVGKILIEENVALGGNPYPPVTGMMSNGVQVGGRYIQDVLVKHNEIWRAGQHGLYGAGKNIRFIGNQLVDVGGGGTAGAKFEGMTGEVSGNKIRCLGHGPCDRRMEIVGGDVKEESNEGFQVVRE